MITTRSVSVTSGKGGVGKTTLISNMAYALALRGHSVLVLDGDLGLANVEIHFGVKTKFHIGDILSGEKSLAEIITPITPKIDLISGGSGIFELQKITNFQRRTLVDLITAHPQSYDYLLIDTAPGIGENVMSLNAAAQSVVVMLTQDPSSFADGYALIKTLHQNYGLERFSIVASMVKDDVEGMALFQKFADVTAKFLNIGLDFWGSLPMDNLVRKSVANQRLILKHEPVSDAAKSFGNITNKMERSLANSTGRSGIQFFWEKVIGVA
jgi:flagellar biosynthesis protein FlhG